MIASDVETKVRKRVVDAALAVDDLSTHYRIEMAPDTAREFCRRADAYNGFTEDDLVKLIDRATALIPPMMFGDVSPGWPNPNNGQPHHVFHIGNEGSRVIYLIVRTAYFLKFRPGSDSEWTTPPTFDNLKRALSHLAEDCNADEFSGQSDEHTWTFRFWWD